MEKIKLKGKNIVRYVYCLFLITIKNFVGQVDFEVGQVNFALPLARGQVLQKCICQPLNGYISDILKVLDKN